MTRCCACGGGAPAGGVEFPLRGDEQNDGALGEEDAVDVPLGLARERGDATRDVLAGARERAEEREAAGNT